MKKSRKEEIQKKFTTIYYEYFTDYLLFSEIYKDLLENNKLDEFIKSGYVYYLYDMVKKNSEENIYPTQIIDNFIELVSLLKKRSEEIEDEKTKESTSKLYTEMLIDLTMIEYDDIEIYYLEYIKRYSNIKDINKIKGISINELEIDIQTDFKYLSLLNQDLKGKEEEFKEDFYSFLNKLFIDLPELTELPYLVNNIRQVLKYKNTKEANDYLHFLKDKHIYRNNIGFSIETFEVLYSSAFIQKVIFNENAKEEIEKLGIDFLFSLPMYYCLSIELETYMKTERISIREKEQFSIIINKIRENIKEHGGLYKSDFNQLVNEWIVFFNQISPTTDERPIYSSAVIKSGESTIPWIFANQEKEEEIMLRMNDIMAKCFDILNYYISSNRETLKDKLNDENTLEALYTLFNDYPKMFFDKQIHERSMEILENISSSKKEKVKSKINRMRKG